MNRTSLVLQSVIVALNNWGSCYLHLRCFEEILMKQVTCRFEKVTMKQGNKQTNNETQNERWRISSKIN